jgi:hypothetical protein
MQSSNRGAQPINQYRRRDVVTPLGGAAAVRGDSRPYRDMLFAALHESAVGTRLPNGDVRFHGESWRLSGLSRRPRNQSMVTSQAA